MNSHELAAKLLASPDMPVSLYIFGPGDDEHEIPLPSLEAAEVNPSGDAFHIDMDADDFRAFSDRCRDYYSGGKIAIVQKAPVRKVYHQAVGEKKFKPKVHRFDEQVCDDKVMEQLGCTGGETVELAHIYTKYTATVRMEKVE